MCYHYCTYFDINNVACQLIMSLNNSVLACWNIGLLYCVHCGVVEEALVMVDTQIIMAMLHLHQRRLHIPSAMLQ